MSRTQKSNIVATVAPSKPSSTAWKDRITVEDYEELKQTFDVFDEDGSGTIDPAEINKVLEELGLDKRNPFILIIINALKEKNKPIKFEEFLDIICSKVGETKTKDGLKRVFNLFDKDENGSIDFDEFKNIGKQIMDPINDNDLLELMHNVHIMQKTGAEESVNF